MIRATDEFKDSLSNHVLKNGHQKNSVKISTARKQKYILNERSKISLNYGYARLRTVKYDIKYAIDPCCHAKSVWI